MRFYGAIGNIWILFLEISLKSQPFVIHIEFNRSESNETVYLLLLFEFLSRIPMKFGYESLKWSARVSVYVYVCVCFYGYFGS